MGTPVPTAMLAHAVPAVCHLSSPPCHSAVTVRTPREASQWRVSGWSRADGQETDSELRRWEDTRMHPNVDLNVALATRRQAEIRQEVAAERLARQARRG